MKAKELITMCPFYDKKSGRMWAQWKATQDRVFLWQPKAPEQVGLIVMPESVQNEHKPQIGVIVSVGAGWSDNKKFHPMFLKPEMVVIWDLRTPWHMEIANKDGVRHEMRYMGEMDVRAIVDPEQDISGIGDLLCKGNFMSRAVQRGGGVG